MSEVQLLGEFLSAIEDDGRVGTTHIGIYAALLQYWQKHQCQDPIITFSYEIMRIAKISSSATYHKSIRELNSYGYIRYEPSFKRNQASKIYLKF